MSSSQLFDKIQNSLMSTKQLQYKVFHNCILAIEEGDVKKVENCLTLHPNLPKECRWAAKKTKRADMDLFQLCIPLDRALRPQQMTNEHYKIVKILLENGSDPLSSATHYPEGFRIVDQAIAYAFSKEKRENLKIATSPQRKVLHELLCWISEHHNIDEVLKIRDPWRKAYAHSPQLCKEILDAAKNANSLTSVSVEKKLCQRQEEFQIIRRLKI